LKKNKDINITNIKQEKTKSFQKLSNGN